MASVDDSELARLHLQELMSCRAISERTGISLSTARLHLKKIGALRSHVEAIRLASKQGLLGSGMRGKKRALTEEWRNKIAASKRRHGEKHAKGTTIKPNGYVEFTRGPHKGRLQHVVLMEIAIGRPITRQEVVHHIDGNRANNAMHNLQLMSRSEHAALHARENLHKRTRNHYGQFE